MHVAPLLLCLGLLSTALARAADQPPAATVKPEPHMRKMPTASLTEMVPMRDGVRLATYVYLPPAQGRFPTILIRSVYKDGIINWGNSRPDVLQAAGYALVWQMVRGAGSSEGTFHFLADDRNDGYDTVEWVAAQPWSDGNVGMDHASYEGSTQLEAAAANPPHLKAIVPFVAAVDLFRELPYDGGIFTRYHNLNWLRLISVNTRAELTEGFMNTAEVMEDPQWMKYLTRRPVIDAAEGLLKGDRLAEYRAWLEHPTTGDAFWRARQYSASDYSNMHAAVLLVAGNFDPCVGTLTAWQGLKAGGRNSDRHYLLIGPWTHGQSYAGQSYQGDNFIDEPVKSNGPYVFGESAFIDMWRLKIAFYDRYLKGETHKEVLPSPVRVFVTGSNVWRDFNTIPVPERKDTKLFLSSGGRANSASGDGILSFKRSSGPADHVVADPEHPVVDETYLWLNTAGKYAHPEAKDDMLVYTSSALEKDVTVIGEPRLILNVASDTTDADVIVNIHELYPDGKSVRLGVGGGLRLRYREGFDHEVPLTPGRSYEARIPLSYIGHTIQAGHRLQLQISGTSFPYRDLNPNTGEPIATAVRMQRANLTISHDAKPSYLLLPIVPITAGRSKPSAYFQPN